MSFFRLIERRERRKARLYYRELREELKKVELEIWDFEVMFSGGAPTVYPYGREKREKLQKLIAQYESHELNREAERRGIEIPAKPEWFETEIKEADSGVGKSPKPVIRWLNQTGRTVVRKQLRDAKLAYWKARAELLVAILALLVATLALFKEIIIEVLKN